MTNRSPFAFANMDNLLKINSFRVNVQDWDMISPTLAKVIISYTGVAPTKDEFRTALASKFKGLASPVVSSFRALDLSQSVKTIVGFVKANNEVRELSEVDKTRMQAMASNLLMDTQDKSLWEIKTGSTGQYIVKQGDEDLSSLVHLATASKIGVPTLANLASVDVAVREFAAYVDKETNELQHGFVVASKDDTMTVVSFDTNEPIEVNAAQVVEVVHLSADEHTQLSSSPMAAEVASDRNAMVEYYKQAYSYDPAYVQKIIDMIDMHSFA